MVDIEQSPLRAFEQDALAFVLGLVEHIPDRLRERQQARCDRFQLLGQGRHIDRRQAKAGSQGVVMGQQAIDLAFQGIEIGQISYADSAAAHLVFIGRTDTATCGADLAGAGRGFTGDIKLGVDRQDQAGIVGDNQQFRSDFEAKRFNASDFIEQRPRINDHAIADNAELALNDAGRQQG